MVKDYLVIVGKRDQERFRQFCTEQNFESIKSISKLQNAENVWAVGPSTEPDVWSKIKKNDRIFFAENKLAFVRYGIVKSKLTDVYSTIKIWGDSARMREHNRLILFSSVHEIQINFNALCNASGIKPASLFSNIYPAKNKIVLSDFEIDEIPHKFIQPTGTVFVSDDGGPRKKSEIVTRFIRDTKKVRDLKKAYRDKCQVCGYTIKLSGASRYSEVHHIHPLGLGGDDDFDNMLVLCPTHHVEFDYRVIGLSLDGQTLVDKRGKNVGRLYMMKSHRLSLKNIQFHLEMMKNDFS